MTLVAEMLDPLDRRRHVAAAARDRQVLGACANGRGVGRHAGKETCRKQVYHRLAKPRGDIGVDRVLVNLARRTNLHELPCLDHADARGHGHRFGLIVGDVQDGRSEIGLDALELKAHFAAQLGVQRGERFVHEIDRGRADQGPADRDALHLSARQLRCLVVQLGFDVEKSRDFPHLRADLGLRYAADRRA